MIARALWLGVLLMVSPVVANDATATSAVVAKTAKNEPLPFDVGGSFSLVDHTGTPRRESDFHGQAQIVYFGYTACPRICSTALLNIAAALDDLAASGADVGAIFITIDPVHDTPDRLADFVARIHPVWPVLPVMSMRSNGFSVSGVSVPGESMACSNACSTTLRSPTSWAPRATCSPCFR